MKNKGNFKNSVFEAIAEVIFILLFGAIGSLLFLLFGGDLNSQNIDFEWIIIIGIISFGVITASIVGIISLIKKRTK